MKMRNNMIKTACVVGLLAWSSGIFAQETSTIEVGEPAPQLMPRYETTSSDITFENQGQTVVGILTEPKLDSPYPIVLLGSVITLLFLISQRHDIVIGLFVNRYEFGVPV